MRAVFRSSIRATEGPTVQPSSFHERSSCVSVSFTESISDSAIAPFAPILLSVESRPLERFSVFSNVFSFS